MTLAAENFPCDSCIASELRFDRNLPLRISKPTSGGWEKRTFLTVQLLCLVCCRNTKPLFPLSKVHFGELSKMAGREPWKRIQKRFPNCWSVYVRAYYPFWGSSTNMYMESKGFWHLLLSLCSWASKAKLAATGNLYYFDADSTGYSGSWLR